MKKNKIFMLGLVVSFVIPSVLILYLIYCLINSYVVTSFDILFFILPFVLSLIVVLIKKVPDILKAIFPILILFITVFGCFWIHSVGGHVEIRSYDNENEIIEHYTDFEFDKYGTYDNISHYKYHSTGIFQQEAYTTILKYSKENFLKEKNIIENNYSFYSEPIKIEEPTPIFSYKGFDFKVEIGGSPSEWYPKELYLVGINEENYEIAHVYFQDYDLDSVSDYKDILDSYCGWRYVLKERS